MNYKPEYIVHRSICEWLKYQHPYLLFHSDAMGLNLSKAQRGMFKPLRKMRGFPDLMILHPTKNYHGLFLELKADGKSPFKQDGEVKADEHLQMQAQYHGCLRAVGYAACFAVGFENAKEIIDGYLNEGATPPK